MYGVGGAIGVEDWSLALKLSDTRVYERILHMNEDFLCYELGSRRQCQVDPTDVRLRITL